jgi:large subunit ribosomal protein L4
MPKIDLLDASGKKSGQQELSDVVFDAKVSIPLMHQVVVAGMAAARAGTHSTKTRAEVSGGGKKPWRQKGTGRARHGSTRSPIWSGGGVAHGPKPRDYSMRVNKKMKRGAFRGALTDALQSGKMAVVKELSFEAPKTKDALNILKALELEGRVLVVTAGPDETLEKSFQNLPNVRIGYSGGISTYEVIAADRILFTPESLALVEQRAGDKDAKPAKTEVAK